MIARSSARRVARAGEAARRGQPHGNGIGAASKRPATPWALTEARMRVRPLCGSLPPAPFDAEEHEQGDLHGYTAEEIGHVELIATTIARLTDGAPEYKGSATKPVDEPGKGGATPLSTALSAGNIHHYLVGAQGALPADAAGNPWSGSYVYNSCNLVLDLLYNLMLESTGRLQKCRIYEMTDNKTARATIAYLIVRDQAHENAYAKALESLGVNWGAALPIPKTDAERFPEVKKLLAQGLHLKQYTFSADNLSEAGKIYRDTAPATTNGGQLSTEQMPEGFPMDIAVERPEEFAPGLDPDLLKLVQATAELELAEADDPMASNGKKKK